ncbi:MAG: ribosome biogenesis GTPase Der [candidate division WS1 bacterium]|jgi:GTP-binding protein|nr:ribosome biogenesis GTPase Der [candidate division WS1 bacterium]
MLPIVAIVGRTNVGKSALFNRLVGRRTAVVEDKPGITRDRIYAEAELDVRQVQLVDTGGLVGAENDELILQVRAQAITALQGADVVIFMVDGQEGLTNLDYEVADIVRRTGKPYVLTANKMEKLSADSSDFLALGMGPPIDISAIHGRGLMELVETVEDMLPPPEELEAAPDELAVAVVGRPNVGKSALVNRIVGHERVIVSDMPGTTRDAIDVVFERKRQRYRLVDTAGLRRRSHRQDVEFYSGLRTFQAVARAHIVLVMLDAHEGISRLDARVAGEIMEAERAAIIVANKWDLVAKSAEPDEEFPDLDYEKTERTLRKDFARIVRHELQFLSYAPIAYTSALTGDGIGSLLADVRRVHEQFVKRIDTGPLNRVLRDAVAAHSPPTRRGRQPRLYYVAQVRTGPPTFVIFVNDPELIHFSYERYVSNKLREAFGFEGTPIRILWRARQRRDSPRE